ncbi:MAG TPA: ABC transporter permease [Candidatus Dormibacteraeota bacterium]|nr:ABC transporter permease [Candidatus Dormibacteraeota bacterium]
MTQAVAAAAAPLAVRVIPATRAPVRSPRSATLAAFRGMVIRDLTVLDKNLQRFLPSAIMQPVLLVFVFTYLFPVIGQGIGGQSGAANFSTLLLPGIVANSIIFVGIFSVGMNLILEMDADELEDRVLAPAPIVTVAVAKIAAGALQALVAGLIVFPIAAFLPSSAITLRASWPLLLTVAPLACITAASLGLALGVIFNPRSGPWLFSVVALPISFFGSVFYTWDSLEPTPVIQRAVLVNPLVYMSEGLRAATVTGIPHMPPAAFYPVLAGFAILFATIGVVGFRRRMLT